MWAHSAMLSFERRKRQNFEVSLVYLTSSRPVTAMLRRPCLRQKIKRGVGRILAVKMIFPSPSSGKPPPFSRERLRILLCPGRVWTNVYFHFSPCRTVNAVSVYIYLRSRLMRHELASHRVAEDAFDVPILLPRLLSAGITGAQLVETQGVEPRTLCMLGKHSSN